MSQFDLIDVPSSNESIRVGEGYTGKETSKIMTCNCAADDFLID